jgi:hypothetical protein
MTLLFNESTISVSWVATITVVPQLLILFNSCIMSHALFLSKLPVGSSATNTFGSVTIALAIATLCCSPPEMNSFCLIGLPGPVHS